jgi:hypothetical protein
MGLFDVFNNVQNQVKDFFGNDEMEKCITGCKKDCKRKHSSQNKNKNISANSEPYKPIGPIGEGTEQVVENSDVGNRNVENRENEDIGFPPLGGKKRTRHRRHNKRFNKTKRKHKGGGKRRKNKIKRKHGSKNKTKRKHGSKNKTKRKRKRK